MKRNSRSKDDGARQARPRQTTEAEWRALFRYGEQRAREQGIRPEDVARLVEEYRAEVDPRAR